MAAAFQNALARRGAGLPIRMNPDIAGMLAKLTDVSRTIEFYEVRNFTSNASKMYGSRLADLADLVRDGLQMPVERITRP